MDNLAQRLKAYIDTHPFDGGDSGCDTVLDQLYQAYFESHESDPPEVKYLFEQLSEHLETLPIDSNNALFTLNCSLCLAYDHKAFIHGLQYGACLMMEIID